MISGYKHAEQVHVLQETEKSAVIQEGIEVIAVGVGIDDKFELESLASKPDYVIKYQRYGDLLGSIPELARQIGASKLIFV